MNLSESESEVAKKFVIQLFEFHQKIGTSLRRLPTLGGKELDVYHLYKKVESLGGYEVVSQGRMWGEVARSFGLPPSVTSASYAIRQHYIRLLEKFEACERDPTYLAYLQSVASVQSRFTQPVSSAPSPFTSATSSWKGLLGTGSSSSLPTATHPSVSSGRGQRPGYVRLTRSLLSGFPNEVDFTFNVLTVLTFKSPAAFPLTEMPQLLDVMLSHVAVFPSDDHYDDLGLECLYHQCWNECSDTNFLEFWAVTVPEWVCATVLSCSLNISPHMYNGLFATRHCVTEWAMEGYRVEQIASILTNLCQIPSHLRPLSSHNGVLRFLFLATHCSLPAVSSTGMDVLFSLAPFLSFPPSPMDTGNPSSFLDQPLPELLFNYMVECIYSNDRMIVLKGLGVLSEMEPSDGFLEHIQGEVWQRLFQLLLLPDLQLVLLCLDTLYRFTSQRLTITATAIFRGVNRCCEVLLSLLTLNVQDFGADALAKVKVLQVTQTFSTSTGATTTPTSRHHAPFPTASSRATTSNSGKPKPGITILNPSTRFSTTSSIGSKPAILTKLGSSGVKAFGTQTVKIGNCVIPVIQGMSPLLQGMKSSSGISPLLQGMKSSIGSAENKLPTILTVQQVQSLLAGRNISITTPSGVSTGGTGLSGGSNVTIHRSQDADSASPTSIYSANTTTGILNNSNTLLRSYLSNRSVVPFAATDLPSNPPTDLPPSNPPINSPIAATGSTDFTAMDLPTLTPPETTPDPRSTPSPLNTPSTVLSKASTRNTPALNPSIPSESCLLNPPAPSMSNPSMDVSIPSSTNATSRTPSISTPSNVKTPSNLNTPSPKAPLIMDTSFISKTPSPSHTPSRDTSPSVSPLRASHTPSRDRVPSINPLKDPPSRNLMSSIDPSRDPSRSIGPLKEHSDPWTSHFPSKDPSPSIDPLNSSPSNKSSPDHLRLQSETPSQHIPFSGSPSPYNSFLLARSPSPETRTSLQYNSTQLAGSPSPSRAASPISSISSSAPPSTSQATPLQTTPQQSMEEFASQWLKSSYEESRGSYVAKLEIYSLYLLASTKVGEYCPLSNTEVNALLRNVFPNALSTKVSVGSQAVYMMAGLAKKRGRGGSTNMRDALDSAGGVVTQQTMKLTRGSLSTPLASTANQTSLTSRPDYSTQSPLAISRSKAAYDSEMGVALNGGEGLEGMPTGEGVGLEGMPRGEGVGLEGVPRAKRIKLMEEVMEGLELSQHEGTKGANNDITGQTLMAKLEKLLAKHHSLIRPSPLERTPLPSLRTPSPALRTPSPTPSLDSNTSALNSSTASPLQLDTHIGNNSRDTLKDASKLTSSDLSSQVTHASVSDDSPDSQASGSMKCCWSMCASVHYSWPALLRHAVSIHISSIPSFPFPCQWRNCPSKAKRSKPSLMAHLQACHCGESNGSQPSPFNVQKTLARLKALPKLEYEVENPLTKAIRLTAALVLRNLAEHIPEARRHLKSFESDLCQVALSGSEASTAVAQCLHYIQTL